MANDMVNDNRFEVIGKAKEHLLEATNIDTSPDEMAVLDSFLFRCWQMGWLKQYDAEPVRLKTIIVETEEKEPVTITVITEESITPADGYRVRLIPEYD